jgi:tRNA_anti-like
MVGYNYIYHDHRDIKSEPVEYSIKAIDILHEFSANPSISELKYLNKTIAVSGKVSELNKNNITLNGQVFCQFNKTVKIKIKNNSQIKIKGRFIGYDDLLEQIKLDQCNIIN